MNTEELAAWVDVQVPLTGTYIKFPDHMSEVAERLRELQQHLNKSTKDQIEALSVITKLSDCLTANLAENKKYVARIAELEAEVERLTAKAQMDGEIALSESVIDEVIADEKMEKLEAEVERLKKRVESQTDWYQQRFDTLRVWVNNEVKPLSEEVAHRYFSICANGSPAPHEEGEWRDTLHGMRLERDGLKAEVERLKGGQSNGIR